MKQPEEARNAGQRVLVVDDEPQIVRALKVILRSAGYATEAATAVLQQCRAAGLSRVWASIRPHNVASRHIVSRLGLHLDRTENDNRGGLLLYVIDLQAR